MLPLLPWLVLLVSVNAVADILAKQHHTKTSVLLNLVVVGLWIYLLDYRKAPLAKTGAAYSVLTYIALTALGVTFFGERVTLREGAGLGLGFIALLLLT